MAQRDENSSTAWSIGYIDEAEFRQIRKQYTSHPMLEKRWKNFVSDVTSNPFFHPKPKRIRKLKGKTQFPSGTYRYKFEPIRVVYYPHKASQTVYPLEVSSGKDASYKRRS
jgi:mRNA-degrading endonuclease RelE of RelBE toxin-antitoxin system